MRISLNVTFATDAQSLPKMLHFQLPLTGSDSHCVTDFVRNFFRKFVAVFYANDFPLIVNADIDFSALCVGKTTNPIKVIDIPVISTQ